MRELPRGYFIRLVVAVSVFSVIAGVIKGFMALQQPLSAATDQGVIIVFATACAAVLLFVLVGLLVREFDILSLIHILAHVKNGRVIKIEGNPESPMSQGGLCAKGMAGIQALYHPNRNKYPMRRVGERGQNQWERITWDEAITEIATKLIEIDEKYGSECVAVSTGGGGNPHFSNVKRFGEAINTPNAVSYTHLTARSPSTYLVIRPIG